MMKLVKVNKRILTYFIHFIYGDLIDNIMEME